MFVIFAVSLRPYRDLKRVSAITISVIHSKLHFSAVLFVKVMVTKVKVTEDF